MCLGILYYEILQDRATYGQNFSVRSDGYWSRTCENLVMTGKYTIDCLLKQYDQTFVYKLTWTNHFITSAFFILNLYQHLMYLLDLKTSNTVIYRTKNSSVKAKVGQDELAKIRSGPAGLIPALL
jgi:hypothetical protein